MKEVQRFSVAGIGLVVISVIVLGALVAPSLLASATAPNFKRGVYSKTHLSKGSIVLPAGKSYPLYPPINPPNQIVQSQSTTSTSGTTGACTPVKLDLRVLVISATGNEADLAAIQQALDYVGIPYTVYIASKTPNGLTADKLATGCHGYYQGVILTNGTLSYNNGSSWVSALSQQEWNVLWHYQASMGVRELSWYTYPNADLGYMPGTGAIDTSTTPLTTSLTSTGKTIFSYLNPGTTITIQNAYTYLAKPLSDGLTAPLLVDANGNALAAIRTYADKRQTLSLTFDTNPNLLHNIVLSYGLINWLTKGLFLGERHIYMSAQVDDLFIDASDWRASTPCGTAVDNTGTTFRMTGADFQAVINWQEAKRANPMFAKTTLTMAYNGYGTTGVYKPDTLTPAVNNDEDLFYWVSHTYDHTNLDNVDYTTAASEIVLNNQVASDSIGFTHFDKRNMVTPDVSGLTNPNFLKAAYDNGIRYLVTDTSKAGYNNPSPNTGIYNTYQPQILMIPRRPTNLFYNVSTPEGWVAEYNCIYKSFWGRNLSYQEILDVESQTLVTYMLKGDIDPWMFHQNNLHAYDGTHSLLGDLLDLTMKKYAQYYNLQVLNPTMNNLGDRVAKRMQYNTAGVTASIIPGVSITITAQKAARVPVTGLNTASSEVYGGQHVSYVNLAAGQSVTLPLK